MNREDIVKALEICTDDGGSECETCPLAVVPGCMDELIREARKLILSLLEKHAVDSRPKPEPWTRKRVLSEAERCVCGQREHDYGSPEDSFKIIAALWQAYKGVEFTAVDAAVMLGLLKVARIANNPAHMDNFVDLAGYAACGGEIAGKGCCNGQEDT